MSSSTTTRLGLYKATPGTSEPVNVALLNANMDTIDALVVPQVVTSTTRPSIPFPNQLIRETDTKKMYIWNATNSSWDQILLDYGNLVTRSAATGSPIASATTTEAVIRTLNSVVYAANRAYRVDVKAQINASAAMDYTPRIRKGLLTSGALLLDYGRLNAPSSANDRYFEFSGIFTVGASPVTTELALTAITTTGTLQFKGTTNGPLEFKTTLIGRSSDYATAPVLS